MRALPPILLALLAACGPPQEHGAGSSAAGGASAPGAPPAAARAPDPEPRSESAPALSAAEQAPGTAVDLGDGLRLIVTRAGSGTPAHAGSRVALRYSGRAADAETAFASTEGWSAPLELELGASTPPRLLPALERALLGLRAGCQAKLEVPAALGFGKQGPAGTEDKALVFEIEIAGVEG